MIGYAVAAYLVIGVLALAYFICDSYDSIEQPDDALEVLVFFGICIVAILIWPWPVGVTLWYRDRS